MCMPRILQLISWKWRESIAPATENRLECHKMPRLPRKTTLQPALTPSKRKVFAASPVDTATPQENQRLEARHAGASKRAFRARHPPIFTLCSFKTDVFRQVFLWTSTLSIAFWWEKILWCSEILFFWRSKITFFFLFFLDYILIFFLIFILIFFLISSVFLIYLKLLISLLTFSDLSGSFLGGFMSAYGWHVHHPYMQFWL